MVQGFKDILEKISDKIDLSLPEAEFAMNQIIGGEVEDAAVAAFLFGMRTKGETVDELTAFVKVMRNAAVGVEVDTQGAVDLCGTGGDGLGTFNISTTAMFVVAGAGVPVLKHGNRSISSKCGSADVLEILGAGASLKKAEIEKVFNETGMAFMFAPNFHPAMKYVMPARKALGIRTFFNMLGPLLNPAGVRRQVIGAFSKDAARKMAQILANLQTEKAFTVSALDGLDEISLADQTLLFKLPDGNKIEEQLFNPMDLGFEKAAHKDLQGGGSSVNAEILKTVLQDKSGKPKKDIVILNAAFAILVSGKTDDLNEAVKMAKESIESGKALEKLNEFITATNDYRS